MRQKHLLALLLLSGFAGLSYELLWVRLLALSFGSTTLSFSTVLAVFFGGLALGSWLGGRWSLRAQRPARAYGMIEIATGAASFLLYFVLRHLGSVFATIDPGPTLAGAVVRFLVATPILLVPTILMGATLPFVTKAMVAIDDEVGEASALIYGINTLGAFLGSYLVTFHLLPALGIFGTNALTVVVNFAVGGAAILLDRSAAGATFSSEREPEPPQSRDARKLLLVAVALTFLGGFAAIGFQVVWARLFAIFLEGTVYAIGSVLMAVLIGIGVGSLAISGILKRSRHPGVWFVGLQIAGGLSVVLINSQLSWIAYLLKDPPVTMPGVARLHSQLLIVIAVLLIPMLCSGASFPALLGIIEQRAAHASRSLANLYSANTVGSIIGSLAVGFVLLPEFGSTATILVPLTLLTAVGAIGAVFLTNPLPRPFALVLAGGAILPLAIFEGFDAREFAVPQTPAGFARGQAARTKPEALLYFSEGRSANVAVLRRERGRGLLINGLGQGSVSEYPPHYLLESILVGAIPWAHTKDSKSALVVGLGAGGTVDILRKLGVEEVTVVEIEEKVSHAFPALYQTLHNPLDDPGVHLVINDARHFLLLGADSPKHFDLITSMPAHPWVASSIFTKEFFQLARDNLSDHGVFCTWFGIPNMDAITSASLIRAFVSIFPNYVIYYIEEAGAYYLIGSNAPLSFDLERLAALSSSPFLRHLHESAYLLPRHVYATGSSDSPAPPLGVVNTDDSAFVEMHAPRSSTTAKLLDDFMPAEYILPSFIPEAQRHDFYRELLEVELGTPEGRLSGGPSSFPRAKKTLAGVRSLLNETELAYFDGRLAAAGGKLDDARNLFARAATGDDALIAARARKFGALLMPDKIDALAGLPPTGDVLALLADLDLARAKSLVPAEPIDPKADPLAWLFQKSTRSEPLTEADTSVMISELGPLLARTNRIAILDLCAELTKANHLPELSANCARWADKQRNASVDRAIREGTAAGVRGDFRAAAAKLQEAIDLRPEDFKIAELLMHAYVRAGDEDGVARLELMMSFQGHAPEAIAELERAARAAKR